MERRMILVASTASPSETLAWWARPAQASACCRHALPPHRLHFHDAERLDATFDRAAEPLHAVVGVTCHQFAHDRCRINESKGCFGRRITPWLSSPAWPGIPPYHAQTRRRPSSGEPGGAPPFSH